MIKKLSEKAHKVESDKKEESDELGKDDIAVDITQDESGFEEENQRLNQKDTKDEVDANNIDIKEEENVSEDELEARLYRSGNNMKVF